MLGKTKKQGTIRPLDPDDPRSLDHPSHDEQWLELARALGRLDARKDFETIHGKAPPDDRPETKARYPRRTDT
jgi:hypothetical protein